MCIRDSIRLGRGAQIGAQSGASKSVPPGATVFGTPATPLNVWQSIQGAQHAAAE